MSCPLCADNAERLLLAVDTVQECRQRLLKQIDETRTTLEWCVRRLGEVLHHDLQQPEIVHEWVPHHCGRCLRPAPECKCGKCRRSPE